MDIAQQRTWGRVGGLTAHAIHGADVMVAPALAGFLRGFEHLVDPDGTLSPEERTVRAARLRRAHMLTLAAKSAAARKKKAARAIVTPRAAKADGHDHERPPI